MRKRRIALSWKHVVVVERSIKLRHQHLSSVYLQALQRGPAAAAGLGYCRDVMH